MIIIGAGSAGIETLGILIAQQKDKNVVFFDENKDPAYRILDKFPVISSEEELKNELKRSPEFCIAVGNPRKRKKLFERLLNLNGQPENIIYPNTATASVFNKNGSIIQPNVAFSYDVKFGNSCIFHANSTIGHKVKIGNYVNISPLCAIIGPCHIGDETYIGAGSIIFPNIKIGNKVYITPGSKVDRDMVDFETF